MLEAVVIFILVLAVLVLVHEWGHFFVARKAGIKVEEFGFGFPPRICAWKTKVTTFTLNWLPLGGFVKLKGEDGSSANESDSYSSKGPWTRAAVVVAGVVMNFLLAAVLFSVGFMIGAPTIVHDDLPESAVVSDVHTDVVTVVEGTTAASAGLQVGDRIVSIAGGDGTAEYLMEVSDFRYEHNTSFDILIDRGGEELTFEVTPEILEQTSKPGIGVGLIETGTVSYPVGSAIVQGVVKTGTFTKSVVVGLYTLLRDLVFGKGVSGDVAGPVGIAVITKDVAALGWNHMIQFIAILSVNLGVLNLIPFPALDGGRLLFIGIELVRGKPVNQKSEQLAHIIGFALLMLLIIVVTVKDVSRFGF